MLVMNFEVSIIIPFYNPPKLRMRKCIESIISQSFQDWELILVDDGNVLDSISFLEDYLTKDNRIKIIHQEHKGVSAARNNGIRISSGKYLCFIDCDDFVEENYLHKLYNAIKNCDLAICAVAEQYYPIFEGLVDKRIFFSRPTHYNGIQYINFCHNKMYKRSLIVDNLLEFDESVNLGEDALFLNRYFKFCEKINCLPEPLYHYVPIKNSAVRKFNPDFWKWENLVITNQWNMFHTYPLTDWQEQAMLSWLYRKYKYVIYYYMKRDKDVSRVDKIIDSIINHPLFNNLNLCLLKRTNKHLTARDRRIIFLWKYFNKQGIYISWKLRHLI